jgi:hypothetical protein
VTDQEKWEAIRAEARTLADAAHWSRGADTLVVLDKPLEVHVPGRLLYELPEEGYAEPLWTYYVPLARRRLYPNLGAPDTHSLPSRDCSGTVSGVHEFAAYPLPISEKENLLWCSKCNQCTSKKSEECA